MSWLYFHSLNSLKQVNKTLHECPALLQSKQPFLDLLISRNRNQTVVRKTASEVKLLSNTEYAIITTWINQMFHVQLLRMWSCDSEELSVSSAQHRQDDSYTLVKVSELQVSCFLSDRQGNYLDMTNTTESSDLYMFIFILIYCSSLWHNVYSNNDHDDKWIWITYWCK